MGCCFSDEVSVDPDDIIADPEKGQGYQFHCKKNSMFGKDYTVYQDSECEGTPWLLVNGEGGFFDDNAYYQVENFVRPEGGKNGSGQQKAYCKLDKLSHDNYEYDVKVSDVDFEQSYDSDASDYSSDSDDDDGEVSEFKVKQKAKFKCKTKIKFALSNSSEVFAELKVKAKGKAKYKYVRTEIQEEDEEGTLLTRFEIERTEKKKLKKFFYKLTIPGQGMEEEVPLVLHGSMNHGDTHMSWESPFFEGALQGGWGSDKVHINTKGLTEPGMELLIGFMTMVMLSPDDIRDNANIPWVPPEWCTD